MPVTAIKSQNIEVSIDSNPTRSLDIKVITDFVWFSDHGI